MNSDDHPARADAWEDLTPEQQEMMSPEFWTSLTEEERQERLTWPTDRISPQAFEAYRPEEPDDGSQ